MVETTTHTSFCKQVYECLEPPTEPSAGQLTSLWPVKQAQRKSVREMAQLALDKEREAALLERRAHEGAYTRPKLKGMTSENIKACADNYTRAELITIAREHKIDTHGDAETLCVRLLGAGLLDV